MTPEERNLLSDLFKHLREAEAQPRDAEAERFIQQLVQGQPAAPYYLAQSVLVQQQALTGAQQRIEELERQLKDAQSRAQQPSSSGGGGSFLSNALGLGGRSPWGSRSEEPRPAQPAPQGPAYNPAPPASGGRGPWGAPPQAGYGQPPGYGQPGFPQSGFGQSGFGPQGYAPRGGGFLSGAAQTAAGVAGGMLAASAISSLLHHSPGPFGTAMAQPMAGETINETVITNNYYGDDQGPQSDAGGDTAQDAAYAPDPPPADDASYDDPSFDDGGSGGDDSWI